MEVDQGAGLRRRVRHEAEDEERGGREGRLLDEIRGSSAPEAVERQKKKRLEEPSPGRTPKSSVQKSLARLGLVDSPDRREVVTTLEEFMAQFVDGKAMGLEEEDIRNQMAASSGMTIQAFTQILYDQASEEQRKGTKGLTKFLAKWRRQLAVEKGKATVRSPPDSWSMISSPEETVESSVPCTPKEVEAPKPSNPVSRLAVLGPPGIYQPGDRKAGTGAGPEDGSMSEIAKAIQFQTAELANLVKNQNENASTAGQGTLKAQNLRGAGVSGSTP